MPATGRPTPRRARSSIGGGPGQAATESAVRAACRASADGATSERDLVLADQRRDGRVQPALLRVLPIADALEGYLRSAADDGPAVGVPRSASGPRRPDSLHDPRRRGGSRVGSRGPRIPGGRSRRGVLAGTRVALGVHARPSPARPYGRVARVETRRTTGCRSLRARRARGRSIACSAAAPRKRRAATPIRSCPSSGNDGTSPDSRPGG